MAVVNCFCSQPGQAWVAWSNQEGRFQLAVLVVSLFRPCDWSILLWDLGQSISRYLSCFLWTQNTVNSAGYHRQKQSVRGKPGKSKQSSPGSLDISLSFTSTPQPITLFSASLCITAKIHTHTQKNSLQSLAPVLRVWGFPQPQLFFLLLSPQVSLAKLTGGFPACPQIPYYPLPSHFN